MSVKDRLRVLLYENSSSIWERQSKRQNFEKKFSNGRQKKFEILVAFYDGYNEMEC